MDRFKIYQADILWVCTINRKGNFRKQPTEQGDVCPDASVVFCHFTELE